MSQPRRKQNQLQRRPEPVPLTQDWADAIHTLMSAASLAEEMDAKDIRMMCLCEARRILRRGEPDPA